MTLDFKSWISSSRLGGVMRYYNTRMRLKVLWLLCILLVAQLLSITILSAGNELQLNVSASIGLTLCITLLCANMSTNSGTRFITRFGTSRTSAWLGGLLSLILWMLVTLVGTLAVSALVGGVTLLITGSGTEAGALNDAYGKLMRVSSFETYGVMLRWALQALPEQALWVAEWSCLFWLLGACLRYKKGITITVIIGVPLLLAITALIPAMREAISTVEGGNQSEIIILAMKWMQWVRKAAEWVEARWQWLQLVAAVVSLPLSWLCMRNTPQP